MRKKILFFAVLCISATSTFAQVTIGSDIAPEKAALLDLKTQSGDNGMVSSKGGGLLLPRVEIQEISTLGIFDEITGLDTSNEKEKHIGLSVYNIGTADIEAGIYVWNGERWVKAGYKNGIDFFYMPSIKIDLSQTVASINLYLEYIEQFKRPKVVSTGAPAEIPHYSNPLAFYYYVTDYDSDIFDTITVSDTGVMTYTLKNPLPSDITHSFINIVFSLK